jgi:hypothetical protein
MVSMGLSTHQLRICHFFAGYLAGDDESIESG